MVRGRVTFWMAVVVAAALRGPAPAQSPPPAPPVGAVAGRPVGGVLPTDTRFSPAPAVPPRTAFQPTRQPPGVPDEPDFTLPDGSVVPIPQGKSQQFRFTRRYGTPNTLESQLLPDGTRRFVFSGGVIVNAVTETGQETEFATDDAVVWVRGLAIDNIANGFQAAGPGKTEVEAYLSGNVVVRTKSQEGQLQTLRASEVYYDMQRERAVALAASLEFKPDQLPQPIRMRGRELLRLDTENWEALGASFDGSYLPSDPGLRIDARRVTLSIRQVQLRNVFGIPYRNLLTGEPVQGEEQMLTAYGAVPKVAGVPVFYLPRVRADATDPLGPFIGFSVGQSRMFGPSVYTTWDMFDLLALKPPPGQKWRLNADYMGYRGAALGTDYQYNLPADPLTGLQPPAGLVKLYGLRDHGTDILGGNRGPEPAQPDYRGRADWRHQQEIIQGLYYQGQVAYLSDKNFLEEFYKQEFDTEPNHETFAHLKYQQRNLAVSGLFEYRLNRPWVSETQWLPRADGYAIGQTFLNDLFVYSGHASGGYAEARPSTINPTAVLSTDRNVNTGRFDLMQELSVPLGLGPVKLAPYGTVDLAAYTEDLNGNSVGRVWGGAGTRASLPLSRLYENVASDLFNLRGLNHKMVFGANYLYAKTNVPFSQLPLLDRLNDDATDQSWRNITPMQPMFVAGPNGPLLATGGDPTSQFNPQRYLIRRGYTSRADTLDDINVLQGDLRQRFQTKRGYPGAEHTVDVFTLDTSVSYFPESGRDNFGKPFGFLEYDALWNVGDRTALFSSGWFEPYDTGSRYYTIGASLNRTDRTNFVVSYRQTDPINSRAVTGSVGYQLSPRYFTSVSASYDFGISQALSNSFFLTRTGTDLTVTVGVTYNSLQNNLGVQFMVMPNLLTALAPGRFTGTPVGGGGAGGRSW
ncbi:organic solvent tolerance protein : Organic solvent tolerance protein OstA-like protein OS=Pirellula staleyi (strain ATCC 27377 / DSM 6068 / ICPB 4128) GN=Psta_0111 PE=4 SV=1: OstA_C [Gemmataceae bacterium]|nr:organic solvent tolerance protein : Organic solvent tolerance protein OstA-like protein OS=Pirellula staleyi (strain ATCC 27377 / DSM 6068 / ICPB 4128) GN=Psta_0111 PE=4 SV=1: OstA_C [Gemmataceae bacterium]VTT96793.1 organic solvent tolerance protein : Organic solvent tolerance protein OstA-like protein OS=Pirellula staleyi (strain ATCC 27377 / DSM 6068 / ICPB 4128) GN=Psta_0111 PE=4 SV=1: OstA_C [Gemmataceae bacterium]